MSALSGFSHFLQRHIVISERMALREKLLLQTDAVLARKGYSRELIEEGLWAWPWHVETQPAPGGLQNAASSDPAAPTSELIRQAATALNRYHSQPPASELHSGAASATDDEHDGRFAA